jgi:hypothetical protein
MARSASTPAVTPAKAAPRFLIVTDQTDFARALEHHISIVRADAQCRVHAPLKSGRLHAAFQALGYDGVLLDDLADHGRGLEWLESFLLRPHFPPVIYFASAAGTVLSDAAQRGAFECIVRERIDHRRLANALRESVRRRRQELALLRTTKAFEEQSRFGPVTILGHRFVRELAVGGTAFVYLAESERGGEMVVLKVLSMSSEGETDARLVRFLQEYELISNIRHPHVVRILDFGIADDHAYIAMEYFPHGDLRGHIAQGLSPEQALSYLRQMASALEVVHAVGILHRDLKPGNVMVRADGTLALIDFGLAKHFEMPADITATGEIFGTPYYMSPEQGHGHELDERSDLYSLGVIFYEMLTRKKLFVGASPMAVIYMHANAPRPQLEGDLARYQGLLDKLLAQAPADRFASARELVQAIDDLKESS